MRQVAGRIRLRRAFGGFNRINFNAHGYEVLPIIISPEQKEPAESEPDDVLYGIYTLLIGCTESKCNW